MLRTCALRKVCSWRGVSRVTILVIQGSTGTPNRHLEVQVPILIDFRMHLGSSLGSFLETSAWFLCELGWQSGRQFPSSCLVIQGWKWWQFAVSVCAITIIKTKVFEWFRSLQGFRVTFLVSLGDPGDFFSDFWGSWRQAWNGMNFQGYHGGTQVESPRPGVGNFIRFRVQQTVTKHR